MALPTLVQATSVTSAGTALLNLAFTSNVTAGNTLVAFACGGNNTSVISFSDNLNAGSWASPVSSSTNLPAYLGIFPNTAGGACTVTAAFSVSMAGRLAIMEFSGLLTTGLIDVTSINHGSATTNLTVGPSGVTTNSIDLVVAGFVANATLTWTPGNGYSAIGMPLTGPFWVEYLVTPTTGAQTATATTSANAQYEAVLAAIEALSTGDTLLGQGWV